MLSLFACTQQSAEIKVKVVKQVHLERLSSASGISYRDNIVYVVGDDSPWLHKLNEDFEIIEKIRISPIDSMPGGRMPKSIKPDFESMGLAELNNKNYLFILSSGSVKDSRDTSYWNYLERENLFHKKNLRSVFELIKSKSVMSAEDEINIEGLAIDDEKLYLFHRGNVSGNFVAVFALKQFLNFLENDSFTMPEPEIHFFTLPEYNQLRSGFSGACMMPGNDGILFTASLEKTDDVISDGAVLGSYVGIIPLKGMAKGSYQSAFVKVENEILPVKLEGITIKSFEENKLMAVAVCDNDDGTSEIINLEIFY